MRRYNCLDPVQMALLQQGTIDLLGEVDAEMTNYVREAAIRLVAANTPPVRVLLNSSGGEIRAGLDIYDIIGNYSGESKGIVVNYCHSTAVLILQACQKRFCAEHGTILIHGPGRSMVSRKDIFDQECNSKLKEIMDADREIFIKILLRRTGQTRKRIIEALDLEKEMTATEALRFGLIDEIISREDLQSEKQQPQE